MKNKCPKGILILAIIYFISSLMSIEYIFTDSNIIFFGFVLQGIWFKIYYALIVLFGIAIPIGLYGLKRWAFIIFIYKNIFFIIMFIVNMIFVTKTILLQAGWINSNNLIFTYRFIMAIGVLLSSLMVIWIISYKRYFAKVTFNAL